MTILGPYEITFNGRKYFGDVALKEFHHFSREGETFLFDVETLLAHKTSGRIALLLNSWPLLNSRPIGEEMMAELGRLDLLRNSPEPQENLLFGHASKESPANEPDRPPSIAEARTGITNITLFLAQDCNLRCIYCYGQDSAPNETMRIDHSTACKAVEWMLKNCGSTSSTAIHFFGGEPLLNFPVLQQTVAHARTIFSRRGIRPAFSITTNATLLTDEMIAFLKNESIQPIVSFDGPQRIHDRQRPFKDGRGSFQIVHENVQRLRRAFPQLAARATVYGDSDPREILQAMTAEGFTSSFLTRTMPRFSAQGRVTDGSPEQAERNLRAMTECLEMEALELMGSLVKREAIKPGRLALLLKRLLAREKRHYRCGAGKTMVGISASGDIYPCHRLVGQIELRIGHVESYVPARLNPFHRAVVQSFQECSLCWARYICGGACLAQNQAATGNMFQCDTSDCDEIRAGVEVAIQTFLRLSEEDRQYFRSAFGSDYDDNPTGRGCALIEES
jgi:uncharacterized protein